MIGGRRMRILILLLGITMSTLCFANAVNDMNASLANAWKNHTQSNQAQQISQDIAIVYGGQDIISQNPNLSKYSAIA